MMFHGTYNSDFYRMVRELLHDQVSAQQRHDGRPHDECQRAQHLLQQRWDVLAGREPKYRRAADSARDSDPAVAV
jgi:anaerobic magnesium-protoporphyrin IX monomethyl ester cyclase